MLPRLLRAMLCLFAVTVSACSLLHPHYERPVVSVLGVQMRKSNFLQQTFAVKLHVQNPNNRPLPVRGLHAELNVGGEQVATGVSDRAFTVPAHGEIDFDMTVSANLAVALLKLANKVDPHADSVAYELVGAASVDLPFANNLPFRQNGMLSLRGN